MTTLTLEYTDTYCGDPNYSWARRVNLTVPDNISDRALMRRAKAAIGLSGVRGRTTDYGDMLEFRPHGVCTVLFIMYGKPSV